MLGRPSVEGPNKAGGNGIRHLEFVKPCLGKINRYAVSSLTC